MAEALQLREPPGILGVGFAGAPLEPVGCLVSNMRGSGRSRANSSGSRPASAYVILQSAAAGHPYELDLQRRMRQILKAGGTTSLVSNLLRDTIVEASSAPDSTVGGGVLEACIP